MRSYLDHASVSPLRPEVIATLKDVLELSQGDPGRPYDEAVVIRQLIEDSRNEIATLAGCTPRQVVFTSSISESVTTAFHAFVHGGRVLAPGTERSSVLENAAESGVFTPLNVDTRGHVDLAHLESLLSEGPVDLIACQIANHETGTVLDYESVLEISKRHHAPVHLDAAIAFGRCDLDFGALDADAVTISGELLGGPMGTAALVVQKGRVLSPLLLGGSQERARRGGLENILGIVGMGVAASVLNDDALRLRELAAGRAQIETLERAALSVEGVSAVGDPDPAGRIATLRCFSIQGVDAEPVLMGLNRKSISVHSGSACSTEAFEPSTVLAAMGQEADRSLRVSVGWSTTDRDVQCFEENFADVITTLRALNASSG